jgi:hypothetical protein
VLADGESEKGDLFATVDTYETFAKPVIAKPGKGGSGQPEHTIRGLSSAFGVALTAGFCLDDAPLPHQRMVEMRRVGSIQG